jgi:hypothetical protein
MIAGLFDAVNRVIGSPAIVKPVAGSGEVAVGIKGCEEPFGNSVPSCLSDRASRSGRSAAI